MIQRFRQNWTIYFAEAVGLGTFLISACVFSVLIFHPDFAYAAIPAGARLPLMGAAMGITAIVIVKSPVGRLSGGHINPAVTLAFWKLGKIDTKDAAFYAIFQFIGSTVGVLVAWLATGTRLAHSMVNFAATVPDLSGTLISFAAEFVLSFVMMTAVLTFSNHRRLAAMTPFAAGTLVALFITFEAPISGMSMNPARTFGSAVVSGIWDGWWVYFTAPPLAMLAASALFVKLRGAHSVLCAKLEHNGAYRCIFNCAIDRI